MRKKTLTGILSAVALAGTAVLAGAGAASAGQPSWSMTVQNLPTQVSAGSDAGYQVTITNGGPSNIAKLYLGTDTSVVADYVTTTQGTCSDAGTQLTCSFGALRKGQSVVVVAAFETPSEGATQFDPGFFATSNGATKSDKGHNSHGDELRDPNETATELVNDPDFAGGFNVYGTTVSTGAVSGTNPQSTTVVPPGGGYVVTAQDGSNVDFACDPHVCDGHTLFGEWSSVNVNDGQQVGGTIEVTLTMPGDTVPYYDLDNITLVHVLDDGTTQLLHQCHCGSRSDCITVGHDASGNLVITAYVDQNGGFKGML
jgi:hypothetical protein